MRELELLAPAGNLEIFKTVIDAGCDAVYFGGSMFSARAFANNLDFNDSIKAIDYAHLHEKKAYLTLNTLIKNKEFDEKLFDYIKFYYENGIDAIIVQDIGVIKYIKDNYKDLDIHASTQMVICNSLGANLLADYGVSRIVPARELSLSEINDIYINSGLEIEVFCHGALCYSYSGDCLMSSIIGGRSGNRGRCAQPCRKEYDAFYKDKKINTKGKYILSLKDLNGINDLDKLYNSGVSSLKIEGRMKQKQYASNVVNVYRKYVDKVLEDKPLDVIDYDNKLLFDLGNRCGFTNTYYYNHNSKDMVTYIKPNHENKEVLSDYNEEKLKIKGTFIARINSPISLSIDYKDNHVEVFGEICEKASNKPVSKEDILKRLNKTGSTSFEFETVDFECDEGIFVSLGEINKIRREAIDKLQIKILKEFKRECLNDKQDFNKSNDKFNYKKSSDNIFNYNYSRDNTIDDIDLSVKRSNYSLNNAKFFISVRTISQLNEVLRYKTIQYNLSIDYSLLNQIDILELKNDNKLLYVNFPVVLRNVSIEYLNSNLEKLSLFDGYIVSSYDGVSYIIENGLNGEIIANHYLYSYNNYSIKALEEFGINRHISPLELNKNELNHRNNLNSIIMIYGKYPLMISANCINKNVLKCDNVSKEIKLVDKKGFSFKVINDCISCINTIYNDSPTCLFNEINNMNHKQFDSYFICFIDEDVEKMKDILERIITFSEKKELDFPYTTGHYKRGVD